MDPDTDIETRTPADRSTRRTSRAPWDPPRRPEKRSALRRQGAGGGGADGANVFGVSDDDMGRGID